MKLRINSTIVLKPIRLNRGRKYYHRYDGSREQHLKPFIKFLEECDIIPQYNMPGSNMNDVVDRRSMTLKDIVRSMSF